jgi:hypothetical protein
MSSSHPPSPKDAPEDAAAPATADAGPAAGAEVRPEAEQSTGDALDEIDTASLVPLIRVRQQQAEVRTLMERALASKHLAAHAIYDRVMASYQERLDALAAEAQPLWEAGQVQYTKLRALYQRVASALESARMDLHEAEFRRQIGEITEAGFQARREDCEGRLARHQDEFERIDQLLKLFMDAIPGEPPAPAPAAAPATEAAPAAPAMPVFEAPAPPGPSAALPYPFAAPAPAAVPPAPAAAAPSPYAAPPSSIPTPLPVARPVPPPAPAPQPLAAEPPPEGGFIQTVMGNRPPVVEAPILTVPVPAVEQPPMDTGRSFSTLAVSAARLVKETPAGLGAAYDLGTITSIGRTPDNNIQVEMPEVSRRHARISMTEYGYVIADLKAGNGTYVNGERITEKRLTHGDRVWIGSTCFVFIQD